MIDSDEAAREYAEQQWHKVAKNVGVGAIVRIRDDYNPLNKKWTFLRGRYGTVRKARDSGMWNTSVKYVFMGGILHDEKHVDLSRQAFDVVAEKAYIPDSERKKVRESDDDALTLARVLRTSHEESMEKLYSERGMKYLKKLGEGSFGQVSLFSKAGGANVAMKIGGDAKE